MNYEKKYKEALERAKRMMSQKEMEYLFPELKESEDERIRKWCISHFNACINVIKDNDEYKEYLSNKVIAWLEKQGDKSVDIDVESMVSSYEQRLESQGGTKYTPLVNMCLTAFRHGVENVLEELNLKKLEKQGEKKSADMVEPKFKVGDWITNGDYIWKIVEVTPLDYILQSQDGDIVDDTISYVDEQFHSFTIEDAKDGDVLINWNNTAFIFKAIEDGTVKFHIAYNEKWDTIKTPSTKLSQLSHLGLPEPEFEFHPATKEQRDLLFQKMKEAGYEWDLQNKEVKKIKIKKKGDKNE